jgi:hypothetical protein
MLQMKSKGAFGIFTANPCNELKIFQEFFSLAEIVEMEF